jgi:hypothetical protein
MVKFPLTAIIADLVSCVVVNQSELVNDETVVPDLIT